MTVFTKFMSASVLAALSLASASAEDSKAAWSVTPGGDLSATLDCHEDNGLAIVSAHRGGPTPGLPENSIEAMDALLHAYPAVMEVDVAQSTDGMLYLMHDRTIDRTTTGSGSVRDLAWDAIEPLFLRDEAGWVTPYKVPTLERTLDWAKGKTVLQIDFKRTADYQEVIDMIREKEMENSVILIAYSVDSAAKLHSLAPEMLISFSVQKPDDLAEVMAAGVPANRIVAFTGTRQPMPDLYDLMDDANVEVIFGTLGRSPDSFDNQFDRLGNDARYAGLAAEGVDIIATDRPRAAAKALSEAGKLPSAGQCGVAR